jgi:hypothetical protein
MQRIGEARAVLNKYWRRLREAFDEIEGKITERTLERDTDYSSRKDSLIEQKNVELSALKSVNGPGSTRYRALERERVEKIRIYEEAEFRAGRPPRVSMHKPIFTRTRMPILKSITQYVLLMAILAALEVPINQLAIRYAFEFGAAFSMAIALFIGVVFVLVAHLLGMQILHGLFFKEWQRFWRIL